MAEERKEVVYELRIDQSMALQQFDKLNLALEKNKAERRDLNKEIRANEDAIKKLTVQITLEGDADGKLGAQMTALAAKRKDLNAQQSRAVLVGKDLSSTHREMSNDISGLTARHERFRDKMSQAFGTQARALVGQFVAVFAIDRIVSFGGELVDLSSKMQQVEGRARVLFGDAFPKLQEEAEKNGEAIGRSKTEFIALASTAQDVFTNLGLQKDQTADLSTQIAVAAGNIEDFTAGQVNAEQAVGILKNAVLGQTKGLKELNIPVKESADEIKALADQIQATSGGTREQAEAMARLQFVFEAINPKIAEFKELNGDVDEALDKNRARIENLKESIANGLQPLIVSTLEGINAIIGGLTGLHADENLTRMEKRMDAFADRVTKKLRALGDEVTTIQNGASISQALKDRLDRESALVEFSVKQNIANEERLSLARERFAKQVEAAEQQQNTKELAFAQARLDLFDELVARSTKSGPTGLDGPAKAAQAEVVTLEKLREQLKKLREAREGIALTDQAALDANAKSIVALEDQIKALDGTTKATKDLTKAEQERLDTLREMQALAAQAPTDIAPIGTGSIGTETNAFTGTVTPAFAAPTPAELLQPDETTGIFNQFQDLYDQDQQAFEALQMAKVEAIQGTIEALRGLAGDNAEVAKFLLSLEKIAGIAQVIMGSAQARAHALFNFTAVPAILPPGIPNPAKAIAAGIYAKELALIQVNTATSIAGIAAQTIGELQGLFEGGIVDPTWGPRVNRSNGDNVLVRTTRGPVTLKTGEAVLNDRQQERVKRKTGMHIGELAELPGFKRDFNPRRILPLDVWMPKRSFADGGFLQPSPEVIAQAATVRAFTEIKLQVGLDLTELRVEQNKVELRESARTS